MSFGTMHISSVGTMPTRRKFVALSGLGAAALALPSRQLQAQESLRIVAYEQGDPQGDVEPVVLDPEFVSQIIDGPPRIAFNIPDPLPDFAAALMDVAKTYDGMDRWKNEKEVTAMLALFGCPFKDKNGAYVAFCGAGIGYCAALAFAKARNLPSDDASLRNLLHAVDFFNYYPSPGTLNMSQVARGKSRWVERTIKPEPGWLVIYDWSGSSDPEKTSHTGIVIGADGASLRTFEFNTGNKQHPGGGTIGYKTRNIDKTVKGYIKTNSRKISQVPKE